MTATATTAPPHPRHPGPLTTEIHTDPDVFGDLADEWSSLHGRCAAATPFQSHAWLHSWWLSYGTRGRLRVVLVRRGGQAVGAAAMMRVPWPVPALVPLGGAISDFTDVLLDDGQLSHAAPALADALSRAAGGALIDFPEVRPGASLEHVYARWPGPRHRLAASLCMELPAAPIEKLIARLPSTRGQRVRSNLRKLTALGVQRRVVPHEETGRAVTAMLELHRLQWQGRKVTPEHLRPRFAEHLTRAVGAMAPRAEAAVTEFRMDGRVVAVDLTLMSPRLTGGYLYGADPGLRGTKVDVATMLLHSGTEHIAARTPVSGGPPAVLSLLRGSEPYKHHWRPEPVTNQRLLLARPSSTPLLAAVARTAEARHRVKELVRARRECGS